MSKLKENMLKLSADGIFGIQVKNRISGVNMCDLTFSSMARIKSKEGNPKREHELILNDAKTDPRWEKFIEHNQAQH